MSDFNEGRTDEGKRRPYAKPVLREYGDIRIITKNLSMTASMLDGGTGNRTTA